jgi:hypothetical protein
MVHAAAPDVEYVPGAHIAHETRGAAFWYVPAPQFAQLAAAAAEYAPAGHDKHVAGSDAPVTPEEVPGAHCAQLEAPPAAW